jgi:isoleucyl-tRNA synthetase
MRYKYGSRRRALEYEKAIMDYWKKDQTFEKSIENRPADNSYVFYDGPPFITGNPHHGTLLSSVVKDCIPRYQTMKGKRVERVWGWDCHGLPAENFVEKQLGITDRRDIGTKVSLETYITKARESMVANSETWEGTIDRIGRWVDFKGAYKTMDKNFMESVWWAFKELYEKGKIYEGQKVLMYDTKFATPVSKNEVTMDNDAYQTVTDPSAYVKFKLVAHENKFMLAWTTTPWTLPANAALAVNVELEYGEYEINGETLILATKLAERILKDNFIEPTEKYMGKNLIGEKYEPLFDGVGKQRVKDVQINNGKLTRVNTDNYAVKKNISSEEAIKIFAKERLNTHKVYGADFVGDEDGTGIVHIAPVHGEADFELAQTENIASIHVIDDNGYYFPEIAEKLHEIGVRDTDESGIEVWAANKFIAKCLEEQGIIYKIEYIKHEYPFNPRSKQRIMYRAIPSWFFDIQGQKPLMLEQNENINWFPGHLKHGRFAKNIEQAPDWNLSRDRFWATAMPVWKGDKDSIKVIGSYAELEKLSGKKLEDYHRPWVDEITFDIDGEHFTRVDKVLDCWFESGSMPFAQLHYPFENKEKFEANYPADFIVEYVGQVRAWFYYVHAVNTALFGENAFKNVITTGVVAGNDGRKMSKSLGNYTDPNELMDKFSADSLRFLLLSSPLLSGEDFALIDKDVSDTARKLTMIWNMYDFFTMYAEVDNWEFTGGLRDPSSNLKNPLDIWIISRIHQLAGTVENFMEEYNIPDAMSEILPFIDDASNWFVRRSRRRFWKSEDDSDKNDAYQTLHYILSYLSLLLAPFTPFLAEELWQKMAGGESVHLLDWPKIGKINTEVLDDMKRAREIINMGLMCRMNKDDGIGQIKIRQPLLALTYFDDARLGTGRLGEFYEQVIADEVNVKKVVYSDKKVDSGAIVQLDKDVTPEHAPGLIQEGFARELIRFVQNARKNAGLSVDDRIKLSFDSSEIGENEALVELIKTETLATEITTNNYSYDEIISVNGHSMTISLEKA